MCFYVCCVGMRLNLSEVQPSVSSLTRRCRASTFGRNVLPSTLTPGPVAGITELGVRRSGYITPRCWCRWPGEAKATAGAGALCGGGGRKVAQGPQ